MNPTRPSTAALRIVIVAPDSLLADVAQRLIDVSDLLA